MKLRPFALAALAAVSVGAHAALTTYAPWEAAPPGTGLNGVQFNVQSYGGTSVALGAHPYINGATMPNDGISTFYGPSGTQAGPTQTDPIRANWNFDFGWVLDSSCTGCNVFLGVDIDPTAGVNLQFVDLGTASAYNESWNMMMPFIQSQYAFNPNVASSTEFALEVRAGSDRTSTLITSTNITVDVPEPGTMALAGLALFGMAAVRRRRV